MCRESKSPTRGELFFVLKNDSFTSLHIYTHTRRLHHGFAFLVHWDFFPFFHAYKIAVFCPQMRMMSKRAVFFHIIISPSLLPNSLICKMTDKLLQRFSWYSIWIHCLVYISSRRKTMRNPNGKCFSYLCSIFTRKRHFCSRFGDWMNNFLSIYNSRFNIQTEFSLLGSLSGLELHSSKCHLLIETFT